MAKKTDTEMTRLCRDCSVATENQYGSPRYVKCPKHGGTVAPKHIGRSMHPTKGNR